MHAESLQLCPTLCDPVDRSPLGSSVHVIIRGRTLERAAMPFSSRPSQPRSLMSPALAGKLFTPVAAWKA